MVFYLSGPLDLVYGPISNYSCQAEIVETIFFSFCFSDKRKETTLLPVISQRNDQKHSLFLSFLPRADQKYKKWLDMNKAGFATYPHPYSSRHPCYKRCKPQLNQPTSSAKLNNTNFSLATWCSPAISSDKYTLFNNQSIYSVHQSRKFVRVT